MLLCVTACELWKYTCTHSHTHTLIVILICMHAHIVTHDAHTHTHMPTPTHSLKNQNKRNVSLPYVKLWDLVKCWLCFYFSMTKAQTKDSCCQPHRLGSVADSSQCRSVSKWLLSDWTGWTLACDLLVIAHWFGCIVYCKLPVFWLGKWKFWFSLYYLSANTKK